MGKRKHQLAKNRYRVAVNSRSVPQPRESDNQILYKQLRHEYDELIVFCSVLGVFVFFLILF